MESLENIKMEDFSEYTDLAIMYGMNAFFALLILIVGWMAAKIVRRVVRKAMTKGKLDQTLANFLSNIVYALVLAFVVIAALNELGVQTASLVAVIGAAGLAIGLALQGSLSNFAAGVMIILFKHFKVGDFIDGAGQSGTVENLDIFNTTLLTPDNQLIIVPNAKLTEDAIINYSAKDTRRIDLTVGVGYDDDMKKAKDLALKVIAEQSLLMDTPAPQVMVKNLGDSSVDIGIRAWVRTSDYWNAYFELVESVKRCYDENGISIPYPQRDLHVISGDAKKIAA